MDNITLEDFEIRYRNIRKSYPQIKACSVNGCSNPRDMTELLGEDTCCAYHRLLFDFWISDVVNPDIFDHYFDNKIARRSAFTRWRNKLGKEECDKIALRLAQEPINWKC